MEIILKIYQKCPFKGQLFLVGYGQISVPGELSRKPGMEETKYGRLTDLFYVQGPSEVQVDSLVKPQRPDFEGDIISKSHRPKDVNFLLSDNLAELFVHFCIYSRR